MRGIFATSCSIKGTLISSIILLLIGKDFLCFSMGPHASEKQVKNSKKTGKHGFDASSSIEVSSVFQLFVCNALIGKFLEIKGIICL